MARIERKGQRRKGPIRSGKDRRADIPAPAGSTRSGKERRTKERRSSGERRKTS